MEKGIKFPSTTSLPSHETKSTEPSVAEARTMGVRCLDLIARINKIKNGNPCQGSSKSIQIFDPSMGHIKCRVTMPGIGLPNLSIKFTLLRDVIFGGHPERVAFDHHSPFGILRFWRPPYFFFRSRGNE